ncbi:transposon Ty3-I Gag-Pol polyprotein [Nephila pilipes]|uniref:Transposon Ty3-I Gag-Pol polyprotein n=1 Tax=Nephila pilipes TaxID=299642 RepID=A0A8X6QRU6_NEPPI|nr:transposon Ty3-I Gag-Pol polyprotein [Nephila pilipes]
MVLKEGSVEWRPVGYYSADHAQTIKEKYQIPCMADFTAELHDKQMFIHVDLNKAYRKIPINSVDVHKTTTCTAFSRFERLRMQFDPCNASSTFFLVIDRSLGAYRFLTLLLKIYL